MTSRHTHAHKSKIPRITSEGLSEVAGTVFVLHFLGAQLLYLRKQNSLGSAAHFLILFFFIFTLFIGRICGSGGLYGETTCRDDDGSVDIQRWPRGVLVRSGREDTGTPPGVGARYLHHGPAV